MSLTDKHRYAEAFAIAQSLIECLRPACKRIELAGSLRRQRPYIGDIEIVAIPRLASAGLFGDMQESMLDEAVLSCGATRFSKSGARFRQFEFGGMNVDLFIQPDPATWGVNFMIRTGSADFSHWLVTDRRHGGALPSYLRVKDARIWRGNEALSTPEEGDVFDLLKVAWIPPADRERGRWGNHGA